ncbi:hypothetical protein Bbelb_228630 [Branchiostoma belcheri]|nr:hypothetical protein Bbelb_228630 [Branchiostoma belcheri]
MHTDTCPAGLKTMLPKPYTLRRTTRTSLAMPTHALAQPVSRTSSTGRTFIHSGVQIWNQLPDSIVGNINNNGLQSFKEEDIVSSSVTEWIRVRFRDGSGQSLRVQERRSAPGTVLDSLRVSKNVDLSQARFWIVSAYPRT